MTGEITQTIIAVHTIKAYTFYYVALYILLTLGGKV